MKIQTHDSELPAHLVDEATVNPASFCAEMGETPVVIIVVSELVYDILARVVAEVAIFPAEAGNIDLVRPNHASESVKLYLESCVANKNNARLRVNLLKQQVRHDFLAVN